MEDNKVYVIVWEDYFNGCGLYGVSSLFSTKELAIEELKKIANVEKEKHKQHVFEITQNEDYLRIEFGSVDNYKNYEIQELELNKSCINKK